MAYSNWGAFVYRDGKRRRDREDVPVFGDASAEQSVPSGARIWVNLLKLREKHGDAGGGRWEHAHHAVLGDGPVRLCGYKSYPVLWVMRGEEVVEVEIDWPWDGERSREGTVDGFYWRAEHRDEPEAVDLTLIEPDGGATWSALCGYCIGAGHEEDPDPPDETCPRPEEDR